MRRRYTRKGDTGRNASKSLTMSQHGSSSGYLEYRESGLEG